MDGFINSKVGLGSSNRMHQDFFMKTRLALFVGIIAILLVMGCASSQLKEAESLAKAGQWDQAIEHYKALAKERPFDKDIQKSLTETKVRAAEFHYKTGTRALGQEDAIMALREFKRAIGLDPSRSEYHAAFSEALDLKKAKESLHTGQKLESLGRIDEAMRAYEQAVRLNPALTEALEKITSLMKRKQEEKRFIQSTQPVTLRFQKAKLREVFEVLARTVGVNVVF